MTGLVTAELWSLAPPSQLRVPSLATMGISSEWQEVKASFSGWGFWVHHGSLHERPVSVQWVKLGHPLSLGHPEPSPQPPPQAYHALQHSIMANSTPEATLFPPSHCSPRALPSAREKMWSFHVHWHQQLITAYPYLPFERALARQLIFQVASQTQHQTSGKDGLRRPRWVYPRQPLCKAGLSWQRGRSRDSTLLTSLFTRVVCVYTALCN